MQDLCSAGIHKGLTFILLHADQIVARALNLAAQYRVMGVPQERILLRIPGSWEGIQAAKLLEAKGISTHVILVYRFASFVGRGQAGNDCRAMSCHVSVWEHARQECSMQVP